MSDPYKECSSYETKKRRLTKWRDDYLDKIRDSYAEKLRALHAELSPAARRLVEVAEAEPADPGAIDIDPERSRVEEPENENPSRLMTPPEPLAPGSMTEVAETKRGRPARA